MSKIGEHLWVLCVAIWESDVCAARDQSSIVCHSKGLTFCAFRRVGFLVNGSQWDTIAPAPRGKLIVHCYHIEHWHVMLT